MWKTAVICLNGTSTPTKGLSEWQGWNLGKSLRLRKDKIQCTLSIITMFCQCQCPYDDTLYQSLSNLCTRDRKFKKTSLDTKKNGRVYCLLGNARNTLSDGCVDLFSRLRSYTQVLHQIWFITTISQHPIQFITQTDHWISPQPEGTDGVQLKTVWEKELSLKNSHRPNGFLIFSMPSDSDREFRNLFSHPIWIA